MNFITYDIDYLIQRKAYLKSRVLNRAFYKVLYCPAYSPGVPPWGEYVVPPPAVYVAFFLGEVLPWRSYCPERG